LIENGTKNGLYEVNGRTVARVCANEHCSAPYACCIDCHAFTVKKSASTKALVRAFMSVGCMGSPFTTTIAWEAYERESEYWVYPPCPCVWHRGADPCSGCTMSNCGALCPAALIFEELSTRLKPKATLKLLLKVWDVRLDQRRGLERRARGVGRTGRCTA